MIEAEKQELTEEIELDLLLEGMFRKYGFDFRDYSRASLRRRVQKRMQEEKCENISSLQAQVLHDPTHMQEMLRGLSIQVTSLFRDPLFYKAFRTDVIPTLKTYPFIRIWIAGCASGEEAYSLAIVLKEEGLLERCCLYATDMSEDALYKAKQAIFPLDAMQKYTTNYIEAGGMGVFSDYYTAKHDAAILQQCLRERIVFSQHNLVTDSSFNEFNVILCRNVMIYFNNELRDRVHDLLFESLCKLGFLVVGKGESLRFTPHERSYEETDAPGRIYRRIS